jgi:hypothetical protein
MESVLRGAVPDEQFSLAARKAKPLSSYRCFYARRGGPFAARENGAVSPPIRRHSGKIMLPFKQVVSRRH